MTCRTGLRETASSSTSRRSEKPGAPVQTVFVRCISSISDAQDLARWFFFDERENGRRVFDGAAESIPIGDGDAVGDARRNLAEVEDDGAESAGVEQVIGGFERVPGVMAATNPDELRESYAGRGGRYGIEGIVGVDVSADFKLGGGCGEQGMDEGGAAGAFRAEDFRDGAAREALA